MSIQVRDLITRLQQMPDQTAQVFVVVRGEKNAGVEIPLDFPDIRPWNPARVHISLDPDTVDNIHITGHHLYVELEGKLEDAEDENEELTAELKTEKENASKLKSALASIRREGNSVIDPD